MTRSNKNTLREQPGEIIESTRHPEWFTQATAPGKSRCGLRGCLELFTIGQGVPNRESPEITYCSTLCEHRAYTRRFEKPQVNVTAEPVAESF